MAYNCKRFRLTHILIILLSLFMVFNSSFLIIANDEKTVYATDEENKEYFSVADAWSAAIAGKKITMQTDWSISECLHIDNGETVNLYINGHVINANFKSYLFYVGKGATLNLIGSNQEKTFKFSYYDRNEILKSDGEVSTGGLLTGGNFNKGGSAIKVEETSKLYAKNIAICGNITSNPIRGTGAVDIEGNDSFAEFENVIISNNYNEHIGGGLAIRGYRANVFLKNCQITNNYARDFAGGIVLLGVGINLDMSQGTRVSYNYTNGYAGGIAGIYTSVVKSSDNSAVVEYNEANGDGAGIYIRDGGSKYSFTLDGLTVKNNYCSTGSTAEDLKNITYVGNGGGIYADNPNTKINNCIIQDNGAKEGGGLYINGGSDNESTVIKNSKIFGNYASARGGGIFVSCTDDVKFSGDVFVENNLRCTDADDSNDDVYLNEGFFSTYAYILGDISANSRVGIRLDSSSNYRDLVKNLSNYVDGTYFLSTYNDSCFLYYSNKTLSSKKGYTSYSVIVDGQDLGKYKVGQNVTVDNSDNSFYGFSVLYGLNLEDLKPSFKSKTVTFQMPTSPVELVSTYYSTVSEATLKVDAPIAEKAFPTKGTLAWSNEDGQQEIEVDVSWYEYDSDKKVDDSIAEYGTSYKAVINVSDNYDKHLIFGSNLEIYGDFNTEFRLADGTYKTYYSKVKENGSSIIITSAPYSTEPGKVYVNDQLLGPYYKGTRVVIDGSKSDSHFVSWNPVEGITLLNPNNAKTSFIMNGSKEVKFTANYAESVSEATLIVPAPKAGEKLSDLDKSILSYKVNGTSYTKDDLTISWHILSNNDSSNLISQEDKALYNTKYLACVEMTLDNNFYFDANTNVKVVYKNGDNETEAGSTVRIANNTLYINADSYTTEKCKIVNLAYKKEIIVNENADLSALPSSFNVLLEDGNIANVELNYDNVDWQERFVDGKFIYKDDDFVNISIPFKETSDIANSNNVSLTLRLLVNKTESCLSPPSIKATSINGDDLKNINFYNDGIYITLFAKEGETIKYQINGEDEAKTYTSRILLDKNDSSSVTYEITCWSEKQVDDKTIYSSDKVSYTYVIDGSLDIKDNDTHTITVKYKLTDGSDKEYIGATYTCLDNESITIYPLEIEGAMFDSWTGSDDNSITLNNVSENITIYAIYNPIITSIDFEIIDLKVGDIFSTALSDNNLKMTLDNGKYDLTSCLSEIKWLTSDKVVCPNVSYEAKAKIDESKANNFMFVIFENEYKVTVNGKNDSNIKVILGDDDYIHFVYDALDDELFSISNLDPISMNREDYINGNYNLPTSVMVKTIAGELFDCPIKWNDLNFDLNDLDKQETVLSGELIVPDNIQYSSNYISVMVDLNEAKKLNDVKSTIASGTYSEELYLRLYSLDDADIYYSIDGSEPNVLYKGELINVDKTTLIKATSKKEGYKDSDLVTYIYNLKGSLIKKDSILDGDVLWAFIVDNTDSLYEKAITQEDRDYINSGHNLNMYLKVNDIISDSDKALIMNSLNGYSIGKMLNISLFKNETQVYSIDEEIKIAIKLDTSFINNNTNINRNYQVLRIHDGKVSSLKSEYDSGSNTISFTSDRFSTYAIVYKDNVKDRPYTTRGLNLTCEEYMNSKNWTWSESKKACVYRVSNTNTK